MALPNQIHRRARKGKAARRSFAETDYATLPDAAHRTLNTDHLATLVRNDSHASSPPHS